MKFILAIIVSLSLMNISYSQERDIRETVHLKMIQAVSLQRSGNSEKAEVLVDDIISTIMVEIKNGRAEPWMRKGLSLAMQARRIPNEVVANTMAELNKHIPIEQKRELSLHEKLSQLENTPAVKEFAADRRRSANGGVFSQLAGRGVGYRPIISTLPQGDAMAVGAVVSPDRRYVRIGVSYYNMSIGAVNTFNFSTGAAQKLE